LNSLLHSPITKAVNVTQLNNLKPTILKVALPLPLYQCFDYLIAPGTDSSFYQKGMRVKVKFRNRILAGVIAQTSHQTNLKKSQLLPVLALLDKTPSLTSRSLQLTEWAANYYIHPLGDAIFTALPKALRKPVPAPVLKIKKWHLKSNFDQDQCSQLPSNAKRLKEIILLLQNHPDGLLETTLLEMGFARAQLTNLDKKGLISLSWEEQHHSFQTPYSPKSKILNEEQRNVVSQFSSLGEFFHVGLLEGITGSGKTEVYIACIHKQLKMDRQALILVPEINLTPQTLQRFQQQLSCSIGVLHSGMSEKSRYETWKMAKTGKIDIVIGTRSSIFVPFQHLGCIIVDEEHDLSYKQQEGFHYSARDLAIKRAQLENIPILLGSATPSLESLFNVQLKRFAHFQLPQRAANAQLPTVSLLDIRSRPLTAGISPPLLQSIRAHLEAHNQILVFLNRRGYSPVLTCPSCGWLADCPSCDARMTLHKTPPRLHCHHCDRRSAIPKHCPQCSATQLGILGKGTEQIEEYLEKQFSNFPVLRVDRDSTHKKGSMEKIRAIMDSAAPCILVGTQMLAKGHNFPGVTLVALIDPDAGLFSADFRALEHTAQQIIQVAGRSGRGTSRGEVIIQTRHGDHPVLQAICHHDYKTISSWLLQERREAVLPPFSSAIIIKAEALTLEEANKTLTGIRQHIQKLLPQKNNQQSMQNNIEMAGPYPTALQRKANLYRAQLLIFISRSASRKIVNQHIPDIVNQKSFNKTRLTIDVDPLTCL